MASIKKHMNPLSNALDTKELRALFAAVLVDLTSVKTAVDAVTAELDTDANVTANNYATQGANSLTLTS